MTSLNDHIFGLIDQLQTLKESLNSPDIAPDTQTRIRSKIRIVKLALQQALEAKAVNLWEN
jgi:hypothetical protein